MHHSQLPIEVIDRYIDQGLDPSAYTKELEQRCEGVQASIKKKQHAFRNLSEKVQQLAQQNNLLTPT